jgi:Ca2+-binding EF-hand superfamily protein
VGPWLSLARNTRSRSYRTPAAQQALHVQQLRGQAAATVQESLEAAPKQKEKAKEDEDEESTGSGKQRKGKGGKASKKSGDDEPDSLTHELVDQAMTSPMKQAFDRVDVNSDGKIDYMEYLASTRASQNIARRRWNCSDDNMDGSLDIKEFEAAQTNLEAIESCISMLLAFRMIDQDQNGFLSQEELWRSVGGPSFDARWAFNVACSDLNVDGKVSPREFSTDMYGCIEEKSAQAFTNFTNFNLTDVNTNGCIDQAELANAINGLFGMRLISKQPPSQATSQLAQRWIGCVDSDAKSCLNRKEYEVALLSPTQEQGACIGDQYTKYEGDMDFELMDTNHDRRVSKQEYYTWCGKLDIVIDHKEADRLFADADTSKNGFIEESEFHPAGPNHKGDGPGVFFLRSTEPARSSKSRTKWLGNLRKTWSGVFRH